MNHINPKKSPPGMLVFAGILVMLMMSNSVLSQQNHTTVTGTVMNEKGDLLSGVTVQTKKTGTEEIVQNLTNDKGIFTLDHITADASYDITFTSVGYQSTMLRGFKVKPGKNNSILIRLKKQF